MLISETIDRLRNMFLEWKEAFVGKGLKVYLGKNRSDGQCWHYKGWLVCLSHVRSADWE